MLLSSADRAALQSLFPELPVRGLSGAALGHALDTWFANDHYSNNPAYDHDDETNDGFSIDMNRGGTTDRDASTHDKVHTNA
ncbi:MAG: hypothetical protein K2Y42_06645 [Hyphomicrobium sp.]|jgi:hypothetical protein|uniref:hypothetical protein n=1 Tax=Hyphomicrobium sp. TaxID=82 RepID=UPI0025BAA6CB|nr:hypothetical protein [Hyphomicrobium sp.]MBX9862416.1 hypothetical protein [Hyphomicrobium sp.]